MALLERTRGYLVESIRELWVRPKHQVPALDGLRAMAILLVIFGHYFDEFWHKYMTGPVPGYSKLPIFYFGWTGVDLFFVLSGYLIGVQLWKERQRTGTVKMGRFMLRRGFRIWPLYFAILLIYVAFGPVHPNVWDFTFLSNYKPGGLSRGWSLSTEEQFYIVVPALLLATRWIKKLPTYAWLLGASLVGVWLSRWTTFTRLTGHGIDVKKVLDIMQSPIHLHCEALLAGLAIALLSVVKPSSVEQKPGFARAGFIVFVVASIVGVGLRMVNKNIFAFTGLGFVFGGLTFWLMQDRSLAGRIASWRIWYPVSRLSYGMYLNHFKFFPFVVSWSVLTLQGVVGSFTVATVVGLFVGVALSMLVATVTFTLVERPFLIWRERALGGRVHMPAAVAPPAGAYAHAVSSAPVASESAHA